MEQKLNEIESMIQQVVQDAGVTLENIEYKAEGKDNFLRIYIHKDGGVDLDDCSYVSEKISDMLDEKNPIKEAYFLEVSSPGAERPLKTRADFEKHINENVFVSLYVHIDEAKEFTGTLKSFSDDVATIEYKWKHTVKQVQIPFDKIAKARLAVML